MLLPAVTTKFRTRDWTSSATSAPRIPSQKCRSSYLFLYLTEKREEGCAYITHIPSERTPYRQKTKN